MSSRRSSAFGEPTWRRLEPWPHNDHSLQTNSARWRAEATALHAREPHGSARRARASWMSMLGGRAQMRQPHTVNPHDDAAEYFFANLASSRRLRIRSRCESGHLVLGPWQFWPQNNFTRLSRLHHQSGARNAACSGRDDRREERGVAHDLLEHFGYALSRQPSVPVGNGARVST